ncbi:MAG: BrnT family toxin, partial [Thermodesulfovibrionales bacterium]|nr:BrnT family toxin [Thermodesulfovibrionales bacterium]
YLRYNNSTMAFGFDSAKSALNKKKHGIDFHEAQALWDDPDLIEIPAKTGDEPRFLAIGKISEEHWSAVITYRSERIRIISVRRARREEVELYEGA